MRYAGLAGAWLLCHALAMVAGQAMAQPAEPQDRPTLERVTVSHYWGLQLEQLEYRHSEDGNDLLAWDGDARYGSDDWTLRWRSEGNWSEEAKAFESLRNDFLYQRPISSFFDIKTGLRLATPEESDRVYAVWGVHGLAPQWLEVDADLLLSNEGNASFELDAQHQLLFTNRLYLVSKFEATYAMSGDREIALGTGLSSTEAGLRLGYDLVDRLVSPYAGVHYTHRHGDTRRLHEAAGKDRDEWYAVLGLRMMF